MQPTDFRSVRSYLLALLPFLTPSRASDAQTSECKGLLAAGGFSLALLLLLNAWRASEALTSESNGLLAACRFSLCALFLASAAAALDWACMQPATSRSVHCSVLVLPLLTPARASEAQTSESKRLLTACRFSLGAVFLAIAAAALDLQILALCCVSC